LIIYIDPNKEGQNVFNIIPQQDLYDPWGRPGAGAPLVHAPTGQKFTRYSGSLQDKLVFLFLLNEFNLINLNIYRILLDHLVLVIDNILAILMNKSVILKTNKDVDNKKNWNIVLM
jgi:hypothetical protein